MQFRVVVGDITKWQADAIVNSANTTLLGSGGVDTAIHQAGGISLTAACQALRGCRMGEAKLTYGYRLPAKYVIHAVGPIWVGGKRDEEAVLASCYKRSLELAVEKGVKHLAFTSIATGSNKFPPDLSSLARCTRLRSPPDKSPIRFCWESPLKLKRPQ